VSSTESDDPYFHAATLNVHCQVAQLECMLAKERNEHAQLMQRVEQLQLEVQNQAHLQPCLGEEKALRIQVGVKDR
jgi:hypothetical protein